MIRQTQCNVFFLVAHCHDEDAVIREKGLEAIALVIRHAKTNDRICRSKRPGRSIFESHKKHSKTHRFCVLPPLKNRCFWWALISEWAFISANTVDQNT